MPDLLKWARDRKKEAEQALQRVNQVKDAAVAQVNPADNGRTYRTIMDKGNSYTPKAPHSTFQQLTHNGLTNVAGGAVKAPIQFANTANLGARQAVEGARMLTALATNNPAAGIATSKRADANYNRFTGPGTGAFGQGTFFKNAAEAKQGDLKTAATRIGGGTLATAATVAPLARGGSVAVKGVSPLRAIPMLAAEGALYGAAGSAGNQLIENGRVDVGSTAKDAAIGGALGVGGYAATKGAGAGISKVRDVNRQRQLEVASMPKSVKNVPVSQLSSFEGAPDRARVDYYKQQIAGGIKPAAIVAMKDKAGKLGIEDGKHRFQAYKELGIQNIPTKIITPADMKMASQGGYVKIPGGADEQAAMNAPTTKLVPPKQQPIPGDAPSVNGGEVKQTRFTKRTVPNSTEVSPEVKAQTNATYTADTMKAAADRTNQFITQKGEQGALEQTLGELGQKRGTASRDTLDRALELAARHDARGTEADQAIAAQLYNLVGEHGSASGQASQILSRIAKRSPAGLRNKAYRDLKQSGIDLADEKNMKLRNEIQGHIDTIAGLPDGPAKDWAVAVLQKTVAKHLPQSTTNKLLSVWKAGLLSGVRTHAGNIASNATFGGLKKISDLPATAADKLIGLGTKQRTKTLTNTGILSGTREGLQNAGKTLRTGIDPRNVGDKYEQHAELNFKNPLIQRTIGNATNGIFRVLGAADQPFYYAALKNSLYDQAKADGITRGLQGTTLRDHMEQLLQNPTEQLVTTAEKEANKAVLSYDTLGSKAVQGLHRGIDSMPDNIASPVGKNIAHAVVNVLAPFVRVPSAFISRTVDFTPLGVGKEIFSQVAHKRFDQRALSQAIGEGITGTGLVALGIALTQHNLLSGDYPKNDPKEQQRWRAQGITPNSVKLGNTWVSLNYLGPVGLLFNAGRNMEQAKDQGSMARVGASIGGLGQGLLGQSFLQGFSGFSDAITNPEQNIKSYVNSQGSSIVPAISNDAANLTDKFQRQADTLTESVKNRIPGLRETNKIKQDVYGNPLTQPTTGINPISPLRPSDEKSNAVIDEVSRLHTVDPKNADLQVTPTQVQKTLKVGDQSIQLTNDQRYQLQKQVGQATQDAWGKIIKTPEYQKLSDVDKANALNSLRTDVASVEQRKFEAQNNIGHYDPSYTGKDKLSKAQTAIQNGNLDVTTYAKGGGTTNNTVLKGDDRGTALLDKVGTMNSDQSKQWQTAPFDEQYTDLYARAKGMQVPGLPELPKTNATLQAYADYLKVKDSKPSELKLNAAKKKFLQNAYQSSLSDNAQELFGSYSNADKINAIANNDISFEDFDVAVKLDNALINSGLTATPKIGNVVRRALGYDDAPRSKSSTGRAKKLSATDFKLPTTLRDSVRKGASLAASASLSR